MSSIIVKNLPKMITEAKFRQHFSTKGTITSVRLKYKQNGRFRGFGFIGFNNESEARQAVEEFDQTFIATSKITVEICKDQGNNKSINSRSKNDSLEIDLDSRKLATKEDINKMATKKKKKKELPEESIKFLQKYKEDPQFREFVDVHPDMKQIVDISNINSKDHANDTSKENIVMESDESDAEPETEKVANKNISDLDYMKKLKTSDKKKKEKTPKNIKLFVVKLKNLPSHCKKRDIKTFFRPNIPFSIRVPGQVPGSTFRNVAYAGFKTEEKFNQALKKDKSFIEGKQILVKKFVEEEKDETEMTGKNQSWESQERALENEEPIGESGSMFFRNLAYTTTREELEGLFSKYGPIAELDVPFDNYLKRVKGYGTVTFMMPEHAVKAFEELDKKDFKGRLLHLMPAKQAKPQEQKNEKDFKKRNTPLPAQTWNSLFLDHDSVAKICAPSSKMTRQQFLDPHGESTAARLALAETKIVQETKYYLEQEGVKLDVFARDNVKRSNRIILVKTLPINTTVKELKEIYAKFGTIFRIVLPPSGTAALIEFEDAGAAKKAYDETVHMKFKYRPLYLEWAPEECFTQAKEDDSVDKHSKSKKKSKKDKTKGKTIQEMDEIENSTGKEEIHEEEEEEEPEPDTTLFVKNLNFITIDEDLKKHFKSCGKINYATVATKLDKNDPSNRLSMGYGFVSYYHKKSADEALKTLQGSTLDGKSLELSRSERTLQTNLVAGKRKSLKNTKQNGSKILVKNIPFQCNQKDVRELFSPFGELKSVRLPKKIGGAESAHRGFGFVEFLTTSDAKIAFDALCQSTHLFGRRLVLEWATTEETVDDIRKRTAAHFQTHDEVKTKKYKKSVFSLDSEN